MQRDRLISPRLSAGALSGYKWLLCQPLPGHSIWEMSGWTGMYGGGRDMASAIADSTYSFGAVDGWQELEQSLGCSSVH